MFDRFQIACGELLFDHDHAQDDDLLCDFAPHYMRHGITGLLEIAADATRTSMQVFDPFPSGPDDDTFAKTEVPVRAITTPEWPVTVAPHGIGAQPLTNALNTHSI